MPKTRNILIFLAIVAVFVLVYIFFIKPSLSAQPDLVSDTSTLPSASDSGTGVSTSDGTTVAQDFLSLLLSVKTIKLDVDIFSDPTFTGLHDSSVTLVPDATIGRPNPFAQFGVGNVVTPVSNTTPATTPAPTLTPASH
jgi:hypothetical protein